VRYAERGGEFEHARGAVLDARPLLEGQCIEIFNAILTSVEGLDFGVFVQEGTASANLVVTASAAFGALPTRFALPAK
jgi:hypothetical protein